MTETVWDYRVAAQNALLYYELEHVLLAFDRANIPVILLKGAALATTIYPTIAHRPMGDVDLLVHPADLSDAEKILEQTGFQFKLEPEEKHKPFDTAFTGEHTFYNERGLLFELHWQLTPVEWLRGLIALDMDAIWRDVRPLAIKDATAWQLSLPDTLLHLCLHLAAHNFAHPIGYRDIAQLLDQQEFFPWDAFLDRIDQFRTRTLSYFVLEAVSTDMDAPVPSHVLDSIRPSHWRRWLVRHIADPHRALRGEIVYSRPRSYVLHFVVADRLRDVAKVLFKLFFPGSTWLTQRYHLSGRTQLILAWLWHPLLVLQQGLLALRQVLHPSNLSWIHSPISSITTDNSHN